MKHTGQPESIDTWIWAEIPIYTFNQAPPPQKKKGSIFVENMGEFASIYHKLAEKKKTKDVRWAILLNVINNSQPYHKINKLLFRVSDCYFLIHKLQS